MQIDKSTDNKPFAAIRPICGLILLALGVTIGMTLAYTISQVLNGTSSIAFVDAWLATSPEELQIRVDNTLIQIPGSMFKVAAYTISIFMLMICASIAKAFLLTGGNLMQDDVRLLAKKFINNLKGRESTRD